MKNLIALIILSMLFFSCKIEERATSAGSVDIEKYSGKWYEIARYPNRFEKGCDNITATYDIKKTHIEVYNQCLKNGMRNDIKGKAFPVKGSKNTKLKVQFFWPFRAGYWILAIDNNYQWALVGSPSKKFFWILSRTPEISEKQKNALFQIMIAESYDPEKLVYPSHNLNDIK
jgi:apolipoprotein D and lipocalin family protein